MKLLQVQVEAKESPKPEIKNTERAEVTEEPFKLEC